MVVDPIDGSVNAKRGLPHHSISIAVADGGTMADVFFAYVHDFGPGEEWVARRGQGAWRDGAPAVDRSRASAAAPTASSSCSASSPPTRAGSATRPTRSPSAPTALRALGTIASTLCQVAAARLDGMVTLRGCRSVDAAAGQLIVREAGGLVAFPRCATPLGAPLDLSRTRRSWRRARRRAWRSWRRAVSALRSAAAG